jgi:hypothetical protein
MEECQLRNPVTRAGTLPFITRFYPALKRRSQVRY